MTTLKENLLVEQSLYASKPEDKLNSTIMASWNYGLGKTLVFTADAGNRWADQWTEWKTMTSFLAKWCVGPCVPAVMQETSVWLLT